MPGATHSQRPSLRARPSPCPWATAANPGCVLRRLGCAASRRPTAQCRSAAESGTGLRYRRPFGQARIGAYATATAPFEADAGNAVLAQHGPEAMVGGRVLLDSSILARQARAAPQSAHCSSRRQHRGCFAPGTRPGANWSHRRTTTCRCSRSASLNIGVRACIRDTPHPLTLTIAAKN